MKQKKITILIVDDECNGRFITRKILEKEGFCVMEAGDWKDALKKIREDNLDLVLLDIRMPEVNGIELLEMIRKENSREKLPVIIYSSDMVCKNGKLNYECECKSKGANAFICKYEDPKILISKIKELLKI